MTDPKRPKLIPATVRLDTTPKKKLSKTQQRQVKAWMKAAKKEPKQMNVCACGHPAYAHGSMCSHCANCDCDEYNPEGKGK